MTSSPRRIARNAFIVLRYLRRVRPPQSGTVRAVEEGAQAGHSTEGQATADGARSRRHLRQQAKPSGTDRGHLALRRAGAAPSAALVYKGRGRAASPLFSSAHPSYSPAYEQPHAMIMNKLTTVLLFSLLSLFALVSAFPVPRDVYVPQILSPNASTAWVVGQTYNVTWWVRFSSGTG